MQNIEQTASRSFADAEVCARTLRDPEAGPLFVALLSSTCDRMNQRLAGTENDINITRMTSYPLERISVPTLVIHGTADCMVPYQLHAQALATRIPDVELLTIEGGEHVAIFTHRKEVKSRVSRFLQPAVGMRG